MTVWIFTLLLCCPFDVEHTITFQARTEVACQKMQRIVAKEVRSMGFRAVVSECESRP